MPAGPGKYDDAATLVRKRTGAAGVVLLVVNGSKGSGFSVQATPALTAELPKLLRAMADEIDVQSQLHAIQADRSRT